MYYYKSKIKLYSKGSSTPQEKYYARVFRGFNVSLDEIAKEISHATSVSYPDVVAALKAFEIHVSNHILNGNAVFFESLGAFIPRLRSQALDNKDDVNADSIKKVTCRFLPSVAFKQNLKGVSFEEKVLPTSV